MSDTIVFCTCFDKNYLDRGLVLCRSLIRNCESFKLYVFCFDDKSFDTLKALELEKCTILKWSDYETELLLGLKRERTRAEYTWTCTPQIIRIVLREFREEHAIYIDADMAFFSDPIILLDEIRKGGGHIGIMEHRFNDDWFGRRYLKRSGKYCVEFNYFDQTEESRKALDWWAQKCIEWCFHKYEPERMGDQKYLMKFEQLFEDVYVFQHPGAGVAPWNSKQYKAYLSDNKVALAHMAREGKDERFNLIFYHFQNFNFITDHIVNMGSGTNDDGFKHLIYYPYIYAIIKGRSLAEENGITFENKREYSSNFFINIWQKRLLKLKVKSATDVVRKKEVIDYVENTETAQLIW